MHYFNNRSDSSEPAAPDDRKQHPLASGQTVKKCRNPVFPIIGCVPASVSGTMQLSTSMNLSSFDDFPLLLSCFILFPLALLCPPTPPNFIFRSLSCLFPPTAGFDSSDCRLLGDTSSTVTVDQELRSLLPKRQLPSRRCFPSFSLRFYKISVQE